MSIPFAGVPTTFHTHPSYQNLAMATTVAPAAAPPAAPPPAAPPAVPPCGIEGGFGVVAPCADDASRVRKTVPLSRSSAAQVGHEYALLRLLEHPNVVRAHGLEEGPTHTAILMDHAGLDLYRRRVPRARTRDVFVQITAGVMHMHGRRIAHRDLKLENLLLDDAGRVRIIDLGLAVQVPADRVGQRVCTVPCGSELYAAPELWRGAYDPFPVDVWALAVVLYALQVECAPFRSTRPQQERGDPFYARWRLLVDAGPLAPLAALEEAYRRPRMLADLEPWAAVALDAMLQPSPERRAALS